MAAANAAQAPLESVALYSIAQLAADDKYLTAIFPTAADPKATASNPSHQTLDC
jgi:hypothetical protein